MRWRPGSTNPKARISIIQYFGTIVSRIVEYVVPQYVHNSSNVFFSHAGEESTEKAEKLLHLPFGRVKHMMKLDPDLNQAKADAVFAVAKATELFLESLAVECFSYTEVGGKKTVSKADFDKAVAGADCLAFLEGALDD